MTDKSLNRYTLESMLLGTTQFDSSTVLNIIPELIVTVKCTQNHPRHNLDVFEHTLEVVKKVDNKLTLKLAALLHDIGKPYSKQEVDGVEHFWGHPEKSEILARLVLTRLGYEDCIVDTVCRLVKFHDTKIKPTKEDMQQSIDKVGEDLFEDLLKLTEADVMSHSQLHITLVKPGLDKVKEIYGSLAQLDEP